MPRTFLDVWITTNLESRKSPTVVVFDVDTGRISIRHCEMLKSITLNVDPSGSGSNDEPVAMDVQSPLVDQTNAVKTGGGSYLPLPTQGTTLAGNTPGKSSYANVIGELRKKANPNVDLLKEDVGNVSVWVKLHSVHVTVFSEDGLSAIALKLGTLLMLDSYTYDMCLQSWGRSSYTRVMVNLWAGVELKDTIMVVMPKIMGE
ncbi:hypothetical protein Tco_1168390, partial [Tanacetum coccineum]